MKSKAESKIKKISEAISLGIWGCGIVLGLALMSGAPIHLYAADMILQFSVGLLVSFAGPVWDWLTDKT